MKACVLRAYGPPENAIQVEENFPVPKIDPNGRDVLVRVHAAGMNPVDRKMAAGDMKTFVWHSLPRVIGFDLSGVVEEVGSKVTNFKKGDEVFGMSNVFCGTFSEFAQVPEKHLCLKPRNIGHVEAASIPLAAMTSYTSLLVYGDLRAGQSVLILGGSGGCGTFAIQIAKALGAGHIATTSTNYELVKSLGADQVINYREANFGDVLEGANYDLVFDCVGGWDGWSNAQRVLRPKTGRFVTIVGDDELPIDLGKVCRYAAAIVSRKAGWLLGCNSSYDIYTNYGGGEELAVLRGWVEEGKVRPVLSEESPFEFTGEGVKSMILASASHRAKGKLVLRLVE